MSVIDRSQDARQSVGPIGKRRRLAVWTSRRGTHLGSGHVRPRQQTGHMIASDRIHTNKLLQPGGRPHMGPCVRRDDREKYFLLGPHPLPDPKRPWGRSAAFAAANEERAMRRTVIRYKTKP